MANSDLCYVFYIPLEIDNLEQYDKALFDFHFVLNNLNRKKFALH